MSDNDPHDPADALAKSPADGFPSESMLSASAPPTNSASGAIDDFVRDVRSRAAANAPPTAPRKTLFRPLPLAITAAVAVIVVLVIRVWPTIDEATGTLGSRLISALTPTRLVEAPAAATEASAPSTAVAPRRATRPPRGSDASQKPETSAALPPGEPPIAVQPKAVLPPATDTSSAAPVAENNEGAALNTVVYSSADPDVEPPKLLSQGPGQPASVMSERTRVLEVLVKPDGTVEQARLKSTEPRLLDPILLSHAKMWQFDPAQRAGRPVPYRLVLLWDSPK